MAENPPADASNPLKRSLEQDHAVATQPILPEDSVVTKAEKIESNGLVGEAVPIEPATKRVRLEGETVNSVPEPNGKTTASNGSKQDTEGVAQELPGSGPPESANGNSRQKVKGVALVKEEYLITPTGTRNPQIDDDAAEGRDGRDSRDSRDTRDSRDKRDGGKKKKQKGQNTARQFGSSQDTIKLCVSRANSSEFSPKQCKFGDKCTFTHDLRKYLAEGKRGDLETFEGKCPVWEVNGKCHAGWKCRFAKSHSKEIEHEDGRKELVLVEDPTRVTSEGFEDDESRAGVFNVVKTAEKLCLAKRQMKLEKSEVYSVWLDKEARELEKIYQRKKDDADADREENRANFVDPPLLPSEKRRIYFGPETPVLAPLTTQGNLPFRRMCVEFGAQITYSEMAMTLPLLQGQKGEWALLKAHESEISPPRYTPTSIVQTYDNSKDLKFGAQVSANRVPEAIRAAEAISLLVPHLRVIDLNCGCPIDLVYKQGAGSALLDAPSKLEKMIRGMNTVSGEIPVTAKIRMGTKDGKPNADKIIERMAFGSSSREDRLGAPGCAAITLHGRSRQQRYTRNADWSYIADCAALIKSYNQKKADKTDTIQEPDARTLPNSPDGKMYFIGNGDCYSHVDYLSNIQNSGVDSIMVARGALIKPWLFEEIEKGQYLDKSSSQRLGYIEKFARFGLEAWGSDEQGVGLTRRFLLEWLSFAHRYVPVGILEHLPPSLQDRPPAFRGRDDLETLLASDNYLDWIKISEMFLGPAHKDFKFQPKHKSNSYEIQAEG
ncbi:putative tRNA-dihydrouridine(47) synthase [NAD(P)(+)] [Coleophoma cylindrospora]|uniref:tRNA-dihydrouridine(47) synthase [NAD(P)(+)] n=1 Tax=Coleophoma cylindrospora TaxID=1849047 RepID=A0A3D8RG18_9HELO|nr:putative tRNA-dihydrouridine(47) synthase [NAD(P)(+)] [Coleophoma cylindrospora]